MTSHIEQCCADCGCTETENIWNLELNEYQRNNLLWLLNLIGHPYPHADSVQPFHFANTGDWVGEVANMLRDKDGNIISKDALVTMDGIRKAVEGWMGPT